ncbi:MAG: hypothetical protein HY289_09510 [Planctomycetes bacterium]|nr:hypothetical protein [Planctomycetota bacterium]
MKRARSFSAWLSSVTFCCCCIFPQAGQDPQPNVFAPNDAQPQAQNPQAKKGGAGDPRITADNYEKVRDGMTIAQVQAILGSGREMGTRPGDREREFEWLSHAGGRRMEIRIVFENGRVVEKSLDHDD